VIDLTPPSSEYGRDKDVLLDHFFQGHVFVYHGCPEGPIRDYTIRETVVEDVFQFWSSDGDILFKLWIKPCLNMHGPGYYCLHCGNRKYIPLVFDRTIATGLGGEEFWKILRKPFIGSSGSQQ
jgi:hypothetical protein